jgi:hypothetical protein
MRKYDLEFQGKRDQYMLLDSNEVVPHMEQIKNQMSLSSWSGGETRDSLLRKAETGDEALVEASEEMLRLVEDQVPVSLGWRVIDDVVGALPNIPAYLAGHPMQMRRKQRNMRDTAPLAIYMDLTSSAGIDAKDVQRRGTVLLALVRRLVEHRSVELWVGTGLGNSREGATVAWQIDTAPLDLARGAFRIASTAMARGFGYQAVHSFLKMHSGGWPMGDFGVHLRTAEERLKPVFEGRELLYVPPIFLSDELTKDPVGWVKRVLAKYTGEAEAAEDAA